MEMDQYCFVKASPSLTLVMNSSPICPYITLVNGMTYPSSQLWAQHPGQRPARCYQTFSEIPPPDLVSLKFMAVFGPESNAPKLKMKAGLKLRHTPHATEVT